MSEKKERLIWIVHGMTNSGKTHFVQKKLVPEMPKPIFIIDTEHEYNNGLIFNTFDDLFYFFSNRYYNDTDVYIFRPEKRNEIEFEKFFVFILSLKRPLTLILEEAGLYMDSHNIDENLSEIIFQGAHHGYNIVFVSQRPTQLNTNVRSQAHGITTFRQRGSGDIRKLREFDDEKGRLVPDLDYRNYEYLSMGILPKKFLYLKDVLKLN